MFSKYGIEIGSAKAWFDSDAQPEIYNGGEVRGSGAHPLFSEN